MTSNKIELPYGISKEDLMSAIAEITAPPKQEQRKWSQPTGIQQIEQHLNARLSNPHSNAILIARQSVDNSLINTRNNNSKLVLQFVTFESDSDSDDDDCEDTDDHALSSL